MTDVSAAPPPMRLPQALELGEAVTLALREMILNGTVASGDRLVETELAERFDTSRGPVRDAIKELARVGLVRSIPRRGTFVVTMDESAVEEIYSMRLALEGLGIRRFAPAASAEDVAHLRGRIDALAEAQESGDSRLISEADQALHRGFVELANHDRLLTAWDRLADQTLLLLRGLSEHRPDLQTATGDHTDIVDAIEAQDVDAALRVLESHLDSAREAIKARV